MRDAPTAGAEAAGAGLFWPLIALVLLSPLPFGSARPWAWSLLALGVGLMLILWAWRTAQAGQQPPVALRRIAVPAVLVGLVALYALVQVIPGMPAGIANRYWQLAGAAGATPRDSISIAPTQTITMVMRLGLYAALFWLVLQLARVPQRAGRIMLALAAGSAVYCAYGLAVYFSGSATILWYAKWAYLDSLTATFVNRNSFATYAGLGLLCSLAGLARVMLSERGPGEVQGVIGWLTRPNWQITLLLIAIQLQLVALLLSRSRAGTAVSILVALIFLGGLAWHSRQRWVALGSLGAFAAAIALFFYFSGAGLMQRLGGSEAELPLRLNAYRLTMRAIGDFPWFGTGFGSFEDVFRLYRDTTIDVYFDMAHNSYLENALELGIPAAAALALAPAWLAIRCLAAWRRRRSIFVYGWAAFCGSLLVGLHALLDFSLQIPAVTITYLTLLAVGVAQSWSSRIDTARPA